MIDPSALFPHSERATPAPLSVLCSGASGSTRNSSIQENLSRGNLAEKILLIYCFSMAKILGRALLSLVVVVLAVCIFFLGDFWVKRKAWDVAWRYENMDKTTAQPKVRKISDGGKYWILEGEAGCFVSMPFSHRLDKEAVILSRSDGSVISYP
jgi:hypothetical protein